MTELDKEPLCKVGDILYGISNNCVITYVIKEVSLYSTHCAYTLQTITGTKRHCFNRTFGKSVFCTYEEAEKEIDRRKRIAKKRELMKDYEQKLNNELGIIDHFIVK